MNPTLLALALPAALAAAPQPSGVGAAGVGASGAEPSATRKFALLISNNQGFDGTAELRFVTQDVRKTREVLERQGGYSRLDIYEVDHATPRFLHTKVRELGYRIHTLQEGGQKVTLFVYYSGHADAAEMELGTSGVSWTELRSWLREAGADESLLVIDACGSGGAFTAKGLTPISGPLPDLASAIGAEGLGSGSEDFAIVASSAADQASRESRELQGSLFTHFFTHGQWGDADGDSDGEVTLQESFDYASGWVQDWSVQRGTGRQDPQLRDDHADRVVADLTTGNQATLRFAAGTAGTYDVFDARTGALVLPVDVGASDRTVNLAPGRYLLHRRDAFLAARADVTMSAGEVRTLHKDDFELAWDDDALKGRMARAREETRLLDVDVRLQAGIETWADRDVALGLLPPGPVAGVELRASWPAGLYWAGDLWAGGGAGPIFLPDATGALTTESWRTASTRTAGIGLAAGFMTHGPVVRLGGGLHVQAWMLDRRLTGDDWAIGDGDPSTSPLTIPAPGVEGILGIRDGHASLELLLRTHYLPYAVQPGSSHMDNVGSSEALLSLGWRL